MLGVSLRCPSVLQQPPNFLSQTLVVCPTPFNETHQPPSSIRQCGPQPQRFLTGQVWERARI